MAESKIPLGPIRVAEEFACEAIPGKNFAGKIPENATPSPVFNEGIVMQEDDLPPQHASANLETFRSGLDGLSTVDLQTLVHKGALSLEQLRAVREAVAARVAAHQSEIQQLNEILETEPSTKRE